MNPSALDFLHKGWPLAGAVLSGVLAFGSLHSDVNDLKDKQAVAFQDHDSITRLTQGQTDMKEDLTAIKQALERIEKKR